MAIRVALFDTRTCLTTSFRGKYFGGANPTNRKVDGLYIDLLARTLECEVKYRCKHTMYAEYGLIPERIALECPVPDIIEYTYMSTPVIGYDNRTKAVKANPRVVAALNTFNPEIYIKVGYPNMANKLCVNINGSLVGLNSDNPELEQWRVVSSAIEDFIVRNAKE